MMNSNRWTMDLRMAKVAQLYFGKNDEVRRMDPTLALTPALSPRRGGLGLAPREQRGRLEANGRSQFARRTNVHPLLGAFFYPHVLNAVQVNPNGIAASSPGLRACELPWEIVQATSQPHRGCGRARRPRTQPRWGWPVPTRWTQGSSFLATLGFVPESLWDSRDFLTKMPRRIRLCRAGQGISRHSVLATYVDEPLQLDTWAA